jgi:hypothetical protein
MCDFERSVVGHANGKRSERLLSEHRSKLLGGHIASSFGPPRTHALTLDVFAIV